MSKGVPFFSVLIPVYNADPYLEETLDSVLQQTFTDFEVVVVNDCSSDKSVAIAEEYARCDPRIRIVNTPYHSGGSGTPRNVGVAACRGNYVALLDADDLWKPSKLKNEYAFLQANGADILTSGAAIFRQSRHHILGIARAREADWRLHFRNCATTSTLCFRRTAFASPAFHSGVGVFDDYHFLLSSYIAGKSICCRPEVDSLYRCDSSTSISKLSASRQLLGRFEVVLNLGARGLV